MPLYNGMAKRVKYLDSASSTQLECDVPSQHITRQDFTRSLESQAHLDRRHECKVGRGGMALFDVSSNEELHGYLSQWLEFVPAEMQVIPLMDSQAMRDYLASPTT